ncbi:MAG: dsDNA nuclease domain-containing protein [Armatimonadota bacterium]
MDHLAEHEPLILKPLRQLPPLELGGIHARQGFVFQDHVAAKYCLDMLAPAGPSEVWCERYDDIVLLWPRDAKEEYEFVQVKDEHPDQLWNITRLCSRIERTIGTSLLEKSLAQDRCLESTRFRIVTSRQVAGALFPLTLPIEHQDRQPGCRLFDELSSDVGNRIGDFRSAKGNNCMYWLTRARWDVFHDTTTLSNENKLSLTRALEGMGLDRGSEVVDSVYSELLGHVKSAAEQNWSNREAKVVTAGSLRRLLLLWVDPLPGESAIVKLEKKMIAAGLGSDDIATAKELRRRYLGERLTPQYLATGDQEELGAEILLRLHHLRSARAAGLAPTEGTEFHTVCLDAVRQPFTSVDNDRARTLPVGYTEGCMYDIVSRCQHGFVRIPE